MNDVDKSITNEPQHTFVFLSFLAVYLLIVALLSQQGDAKFEHLHLVLDTGNGILSLLLAVFLLAEQHNIEHHIRQYLAIGLGIAAFTEISHALVGIEWTGSLAWIQTYSHTLRPATWPPSTYVLPIAMAWILWIESKNRIIPPLLFTAIITIVTITLFSLAGYLPKYVDTGVLGIQRPTQLPLLLLWLIVIGQCWRIRHKHPLYEGLAWMGVLLFLSDLFMLYSTSPHEKFTMMAHSGKLIAYMLLHVIQMRVAASDAQARIAAEKELRIAATVFESQVGMMVTDANRVIQRVNYTFTQITGYETQDVVGKSPRLLKSGHHDELFYTQVWESVANTGSWNGEIWNRRKNGEIYPEHITITAVSDENNVISHYVATFNDITLRKAAEEEMKNFAFYDPLTQLPNRRLITNRIEQALASSTRYRTNGAILFIDLDNFKTLNDTLGHDMGDLLLSEVAFRLNQSVRKDDTVARLGGDEFVVLLENLSTDSSEAIEQSKTVAEKILNNLNLPYQLAESIHFSSPSIGVALFTHPAQTTDELLKQADIAMYQAKKSGRNTLCFFNADEQHNSVCH